MQDNEVLRTIRTRRSIREFKDRPLETETIETIVDAGRMAPTARNRQGCHFIVVTDREVIAEMSRLCVKLATFVMKNHWWTRLFAPIARDAEFRRTVLTRRGGLEDPVYYKAPCVVLTLGEKGNEYAHDDCVLACQNMQLAAWSLGVGSIMLGYGAVFARTRRGRQLVGMPKGYTLDGVVALGHPAHEIDKVAKRKENLLGWVGER